MTVDQIIPGAYYCFTPDSRHCTEGIAYADQAKLGDPVVLRDTFWGVRGTTAFMVGHNCLSDNEALSLELLFHPAEGWRSATGNDVIMNFDPDDVRVVTSQHGLDQCVWVREGSGPSKAIEIQREKDELERLRGEAHAAARRVEWQAMIVGRLVAEAAQEATHD